MKKATRYKRTTRSVACTLLMAMLAATAAPAAQAAEGQPAQSQPAKEEVVYALLGENGAVQGVYMVNKLYVAEAGEVLDYGSYSSLRNMTDNAALQNEGGQVRFSAPAGQFYYEGALDDAQLPWLFDIRYTLDGREASARQLAGQSGALRLEIDIAQNPRANEVFFEDYALQLAVTLDTGRCANIKAHGATAANIGADRQYTYTLLPGTEKTIVLTADVEDFEMDPISINGVRLSLDLDIDDEQLLAQVAALSGGIARVDDGAQALSGGVDEMARGVAELQVGTATMQAGLNALHVQSSALTEGSAKMRNGLAQVGAALDGMALTAEDLSALVAASATVRGATEEAAAGAAGLQQALGYDAYRAAMQQNGVDVDALAATNGSAAASLDEQIAALAALRDSLPDDDPAKAQLTAAIDSLGGTSGLLAANSAALAGLPAYFAGLYDSAAPLVEGTAALSAHYAAFDDSIARLADTLGSLPELMGRVNEGAQQIIDEYARLDDGINEYTQGVAALVAGYAQLSNGVSALAAGCTELQAGCAGLTEGTGELRRQTDGMDAMVGEQIDEALKGISGETGEGAVSFVSKKNQNVKSVQFAIRTNAIEKEEPAAEAQPEETPGVWDRLLGLFGK